MDLIKDDIGKLYRRFLIASFGSALIASIYGLVDMMMVGQYHGPVGAAAMAVIAPIWNILYSFGLLAGIGGSVLYGVARGTQGSDTPEGRACANGYFTASVLFGAALSLVLWAVMWGAEEPLLRLFGASDELMPLCRAYLKAPKLTVPVYVFTNILSAFLRNDGNPALATRAVIAGGVFNVFGDWFFVFALDMGIEGAGIATAMGASASVLVMGTHFLTRRNTLRFVRPRRLPALCGRIAVNGFSSFVVDVAMGVLTMLFNRQIMRHLDGDALAVYGVIVSVSTFVQCCSYGVGQAAQPLLSQNYGARQTARIRTLLRYNLLTAAVIGALWTALVVAAPNACIRAFMSPTAEVLAIAPPILRVYALSFLLLPFNVYATYYFQAVTRAGTSLALSTVRGVVLSGALILVLPRLCGGDAIWWAMPLTEAAVAVAGAWLIRRQLRGMG